MLTFLIAVLAGLLCGVLSGFGIGGGSLLMVWLTAAQSMEQRTAQGVNCQRGLIPIAKVCILQHFSTDMRTFQRCFNHP